MSFRRILVALLVGVLFSFSFARESEPDFEGTQGEDYYVVSPEEPDGEKLVYILKDHILVHSTLEQRSMMLGM